MQLFLCVLVHVYVSTGIRPRPGPANIIGRCWSLSWHLQENLLFHDRKYLVVRAPVMLIPQKACSTRSSRFHRHMVATPTSKLNNLSTGPRSEWEKLVGLNLHIKSERVYLESCEPFGLSDWLKYATRPANELPLRRLSCRWMPCDIWMAMEKSPRSALCWYRGRLNLNTVRGGCWKAPTVMIIYSVKSHWC